MRSFTRRHDRRTHDPAKPLLAVVILATLVATSVSSARAGDPPLALDALETRIDEAPGVRADSRQIDADIQAEGVTYARGGLNYVFDNGIGPRSDIITKYINSNAFRYAQSIGVQLPILGTAIAQSNLLDTSRKVESLARITYQSDRRMALAKLRSAYVLYWQYDRQEAVARNYVDRFKRDLPAARALRHNGFWTESNLLDYLEALSRFETDARNARNSRRGQLTIISSAIGAHVAAFHPLDPTFATDCRPLEYDAVASAVAIDPELATIEANATELKAEASRIRGSSIDARVTANLGTVADIVPARLGYELTVGLAVSLPAHARSEERSLRDELDDELDAEALRTAQRRADITANVEEVLDELDDARDDLRQAGIDSRATNEALREAEVRYRTLAGPAGPSFNDVETRLAENFTSENDAVVAQSAVYQKLEALLETAPDSCT
jgi:hypothetical protein